MLRSQFLADTLSHTRPPPFPAPCSCYTNCARWKDLDYRLIKTYEVPDGDQPGVLAAKVLAEVQAALGVVQQRIDDSLPERR